MAIAHTQPTTGLRQFGRLKDPENCPDSSALYLLGNRSRTPQSGAPRLGLKRQIWGFGQSNLLRLGQFIRMAPRFAHFLKRGVAARRRDTADRMQGRARSTSLGRPCASAPDRLNQGFHATSATPLSATGPPGQQRIDWEKTTMALGTRNLGRSFGWGAVVASLLCMAAGQRGTARCRRPSDSPWSLPGARVLGAYDDKEDGLITDHDLYEIRYDESCDNPLLRIRASQ